MEYISEAYVDELKQKVKKLASRLTEEREAHAATKQELTELRAKGRDEDYQHINKLESALAENYLGIEWLSHELDILNRRLVEAPEVVIMANGWETNGLKKAIRYYQAIAIDNRRPCRVKLVEVAE